MQTVQTLPLTTSPLVLRQDRTLTRRPLEGLGSGEGPIEPGLILAVA